MRSIDGAPGKAFPAFCLGFGKGLQLDYALCGDQTFDFLLRSSCHNETAGVPTLQDFDGACTNSVPICC